MTPNELRTFILNHPDDFPVTIAKIATNVRTLVPDVLDINGNPTYIDTVEYTDTDPPQYEAQNGGDDQALATALMAHPDWPTEYNGVLQTSKALLKEMGGIQGTIFLKKLRGFALLTDAPTIAALQAGLNQIIQAKPELTGLTIELLQDILNESLPFLVPANDGIDFSSQATQDIMELLVALNVVNEAETDAALATQAYKPTITANDVAKALGRG
jgi:hypothetical protein